MEGKVSMLGVSSAHKGITCNTLWIVNVVNAGKNKKSCQGGKNEILIRTRKEKAQEKKSESKSKTQDAKREQAEK